MKIKSLQIKGKAKTFVTDCEGIEWALIVHFNGHYIFNIILLVTILRWMFCVCYVRHNSIQIFINKWYIWWPKKTYSASLCWHERFSFPAHMRFVAIHKDLWEIVYLNMHSECLIDA